MKILQFVLIGFISLTTNLFSQNKPIEYLDPLPGAVYINPETNIIVKPSINVLKSFDTEKKHIKINASLSGEHRYTTILSADGRTIIIKPEQPFYLSDVVHITISSDITSNNAPYDYFFTVKSKVVVEKQDILSEFKSEQDNNIKTYNSPTNNFLGGDFPSSTIINSTSPSKGYIFLSSYSNSIYGSYLLIFDNFGDPVFSRLMKNNCSDFKMQPNGYMTYFAGGVGKYYAMNKYYEIIDSFYCGNNYTTDTHELRILDDGSAYMMSYDPQIVDMSKVVNGGDTAAVVTGLIIQQIDRNKNVIFQWRSWDHFNITDATHLNLLNHNIDYVHGNAIEIDTDNNIMISSRHLDEITKISRSTGNIIWRLGGKNNQFSFVNDTVKISYQHAIRKLDNGNIILFDNGNYHTPPYTRIVEYRLNETNKTAELVWEYRHTPDIYSAFMGYAQRLDNGNTLIGWGGQNPSVTEVTQNGTVVFEMTLPQGVFSYRAFRFDLDSYYPLPTKFSLSQNYPNPFNPKTTIKFEISKPEFVTLKVYNLLGQEVASIFEGQLAPESYTMEWNASNLSSGVYFYVIKSESYGEAKKMILLK